MKIVEVIEVLDAIVTFYPGSFTVKAEAYETTAKAWHLFLKDIDKETAMKNLQEHIKTERFPPSIADLLKIPTQDKYENGRRAIPSAEETKLMLESYENKTPASPEVREKALAEMAKSLGIKRGGQA